MTTPYSHLSNEQLIASLKALEDEIDKSADYEEWVAEHDWASGVVDALRHDLDYMVADYNWMLNEMAIRGLKKP